MRVIIVPEPHIWDKNFTSIPNSKMDLASTMMDVLRIIQEESFKDKIAVMFPGDIFHRGLRDADTSMDWQDYFIYIWQLTEGRLFSAVGNHELTYRQYNPFWRMSESESEFINRYNFIRSAKANIRPFRIVDKWVYGNTEFIFWHYGANISEYTSDAENVVIISHQPILDNEMASILMNKYNRDQLMNIIDYKSIRNMDALPKLANIRYVFNGHMHSAYSRFCVDEIVNGVPYKFVLQYLGSLGRTQAPEVRDTDLTRRIPILCISEEGPITEADRFVELQGEECLDQKKIEDNREKYHRAAEIGRASCRERVS